MNTLSFLKNWLVRTAVWFTVISVATLLFGLMFLPEEDHVTTLSFLLFFPFSLCASAAGMLWRTKKLRTVLKYLAHYAIFLVATALFIFLPSGINLSVPFVIILVILFTVLWWISRGIVHILRTKLLGEN